MRTVVVTGNTAKFCDLQYTNIPSHCGKSKLYSGVRIKSLQMPKSRRNFQFSRSKLNCIQISDTDLCGNIPGPSKGFGPQATTSENVTTDHFQSADKRQKVSGKSRQFATVTNCMQHNQTNIQFQFLLKSDSDI